MYHRILINIVIVITVLITHTNAYQVMGNATCSWEATGDIFRGIALALQKNTTDLTSDCFLNSDKVVEDGEGLVVSVEDLVTYYSTAEEKDLPPHL